MFSGPLPPQSNRADANWAWQLTDVDSGTAVDLTGATITVTIYDIGGTEVLSGSTSTGEVTIPEAGVIFAYFPKISISALPAGRYEASVVIERDGFTDEPFRNSLAVTGDE